MGGTSADIWHFNGEIENIGQECKKQYDEQFADVTY